MLGDDLVRRQRADEAVRAAGAERASHRASDLRRDALREAPCRRDEDGFHRFAVLEAEQQLLSSVGGLRDVEDLAGRQREVGLQRLAEVLGQRRGRVPVRYEVAIERLQYLVGAKGTQPPILKDRFPFVRQDAPRACHSVAYYTIFGLGAGALTIPRQIG